MRSGESHDDREIYLGTTVSTEYSTSRENIFGVATFNTGY